MEIGWDCCADIRQWCGFWVDVLIQTCFHSHALFCRLPAATCAEGSVCVGERRWEWNSWTTPRPRRWMAWSQWTEAAGTDPSDPSPAVPSRSWRSSYVAFWSACAAEMGCKSWTVSDPPLTHCSLHLPDHGSAARAAAGSPTWFCFCSVSHESRTKTRYGSGTAGSLASPQPGWAEFSAFCEMGRRWHIWSNRFGSKTPLSE